VIALLEESRERGDTVRGAPDRSLEAVRVIEPGVRPAPLSRAADPAASPDAMSSRVRSGRSGRTDESGSLSGSQNL
jgi:hypothetical protein